MIKIECPQCGSEKLRRVGLEGDIYHGAFIEAHECQECKLIFDVKAFCSDIEIR